MRVGIPIRFMFAAVLLCYGATAGLSWRCEKILFPGDPGLPAQAGGGEDSSSEPGASQRTGQTAENYFADYRFTNFNRDSISLRYQAPKKSYTDYCSRFWYSRAELDAAGAGGPSAQRDYLASRGFKLLPGHVVEADVPLIVQRSARPLQSVALALDSVAKQKGYDSETLVGAATALVQTALRYRIPPLLENGLHTGGILPPVMAMVRGWGDCDTKTGVLASVLANWPAVRMVGIRAPEHYLMGILRLPGQGESFVEYQGLNYVLIEPAGPAWLPPGTVSVDTMPLLQGSEGFQVESLMNAPG